MLSLHDVVYISRSALLCYHVLADVLPVLLQAYGVIENYVRYDPNLLLKAAATGIVEVWNVLVEAIEAEGKYLLQQVSNDRVTIDKITSASLRQTSS